MSIKTSFIEIALGRKVIERQKIQLDAITKHRLHFHGGKTLFDFSTTEVFIENWVNKISGLNKVIVIEGSDELQTQKNQFAINLYSLYFQSYCRTIAQEKKDTFIFTPDVYVNDIIAQLHLPLETKFDTTFLLFVNAHLFNQKVPKSGITRLYSDPTYEKLCTTNIHAISNDLFNLVDRCMSKIKILFFTTSSYRLLDSRILDMCPTILLSLETNILTVSQRCVNKETEEPMFILAEKLLLS